MNLKDIEWNNLILETETVRSVTSDRSLENLIQVGNPFVLNAVKYYKRSNQVDSAMSFFKEESDFYYVRLPLSFRPSEGLTLDLVSVEINLQGANKCEAWSLQPLKVEQEIKVGIEAKIDGKLGISPVELSSSIGSSEEYIVYQPYIEAFNLGRNDPAWEFRPTEGRHLSGIQLLHLVIRQDKESVSQGRVSIKGDATDKRGMFSFWGKIKNTTESASFTCSPAHIS